MVRFEQTFVIVAQKYDSTVQNSPAVELWHSQQIAANLKVDQ